MEKVHVYFMPGMAASSTIFERIELPKDKFEIHLLEWVLPLDKETLHEYAERIALEIKHENPILIGVSFGGVLVQEMGKIVNAKKVIIISSVKSNAEFPRRMKLAKTIKAYKVFPTGWAQNVEFLAKLPFGQGKMNQRLKLYEKFLSMRDKKYLDWALEKIILWDRAEADENVIHIHGDADEVFPPKNIKNFIPIKGGTHIMIINKFKWLNDNLPRIILEN